MKTRMQYTCNRRSLKNRSTLDENESKMPFLHNCGHFILFIIVITITNRKKKNFIINYSLQNNFLNKKNKNLMVWLRLIMLFH